MGWLWASSSPATAPDPVPQSQPAPVDPEVQKFIDLFKTDASTAPSVSSPLTSVSSTSASSSPPSLRASWLSLKAATADKTSSPSSPAAAVDDAPRADALAESLLPTEMSCRQAFDLAWGCNSIGGQFNSIYRYGTMRSCSDKWEDFWFCMRTKSYTTGPLKESMIRDHYRRKEYAKYGPGKPSSQDVWDTRSDKVQPGSVFVEPISIVKDECRRN